MAVFIEIQEVNRDYFYIRLGEHFPGMKALYMESYKYAYEIPSRNNDRLMNMLKTTCRFHGIYNIEECWTNNVYQYRRVILMINKIFIPFPKLETERLILRQVDDEDVEPLYEMLSDIEVAKYDYFYPVTSKAEVMKFIERYKKELEENEEITWGIILKGTNKLIGTCCLGDFDEGARRAEIGYDITQGEWSKGYATEALGVVIDFGFNLMNLNRIEATITPGNDASVKVLRKLNFAQEGIVRERDLIKGKLEDGIIMSILKREYIRKSVD